MLLARCCFNRGLGSTNSKRGGGCDEGVATRVFCFFQCNIGYFVGSKQLNLKPT